MNRVATLKKNVPDLKLRMCRDLGKLLNMGQNTLGTNLEIVTKMERVGKCQWNFCKQIVDVLNHSN